MCNETFMAFNLDLIYFSNTSNTDIFPKDAVLSGDLQIANDYFD